MRVRSFHRRVVAGSSNSPASGLPAVVTATVVGNRCVGSAPDRLARRARRLADAAGVDLLTVRFSGETSSASIVAVDPWPDVAEPDVCDAVLAYLMHNTRP